MRIYCNSWPKSGTHVLWEFARVLLGERKWYKDWDIKAPEREAELFERIDERIERHKEDFALKGHLPWSPTIEAGLIERKFVILFSVRDPRDVLCSTYRWLMDLRPSWDISRWLRDVKDDDERLTWIIKGMPLLDPFGSSAGIRWEKPLPGRYELLTPWTESPRACCVRFEPLIGATGLDAQVKETRRLVDAVGEDTTLSVEEIAQRLYQPKSQTFHTGRSGTWTEYFSDAHRELFVELGGETLVKRFGYPPTDSAPPRPASGFPCRATTQAHDASSQKNGPAPDAARPPVAKKDGAARPATMTPLHSGILALSLCLLIAVIFVDWGSAGVRVAIGCAMLLNIAVGVIHLFRGSSSRSRSGEQGDEHHSGRA